MIGNFLDQYLITARLGRGSLGDTYLGESARDQTAVVLKVIDPELAAKPGLVAKIAQLGRLNSPYVLPFTHEAASGQHYLLMLDYFQDNLHAYLSKLQLKDEEITAETAVSLILHLITRLHKIDYSQLSIHGGLHPRNMLLTFEGNAVEIILSDFCQAEWVRQATAKDDQPVRGLAPFTPHWLWPEDDKPPTAADSRADLFALGHLLYFLLHKSYLHLTAAEADAKALDSRYKKLVEKIIRREKVKQPVELVDYATWAALTAVRLHTHAPEEASHTRLWQCWHHALLTMLRNDFSLLKLTHARPEIPEDASDSQTQPEAIDVIWEIAEPHAFLEPDAPEAQFHLPPLRPEEPTAEEGQTQETQREPDNSPYIEISRPGSTNGTGKSQASRYFPIRPNQALITVGSHSANDICLTQDAQIGPDHLTIRKMGPIWQLFARGSGILLDGSRIFPEQPEPWPANAHVTLGSYTLRLHLPGEDPAEEQIILELVPAQLVLQPGIKKKIGISIRNNGEERSYFKAELIDSGPLDKPLTQEGTAPERESKPWFYLPQDGLVLNSGEQKELTIEVRPSLDQPSQTRLFQVKVRRLGQQIVERQIQGQVYLQHTTDFVTRLEPVNSSANGAFRLLIRNDSNKAQTYVVHGGDEQKALKFAAVGTAVEDSNPDKIKPAAAPTKKARPWLPSNLARFLFVRSLQRQLRWSSHAPAAAVAEVRQQQRNADWALRASGTTLPKSRLEFPSVRRSQLKFSETFRVEKTVAPNEQAILFFMVRPRKRPFRWKPEREIPFTLTTSPVHGAAEGQEQKETAVLHVASRLSRAVWVLLLGLLLVSCLLLSGFATFRTSNVVKAFQANQATAIYFDSTDVDGDSLPSDVEVALYNTNPRLADTDGDGMSDGLEVSLADTRICPTMLDCNGNGLADPVEIGFATTTPTPPGGSPFVTAVPTPTATKIPTVTPTSPPAPETKPTFTAIIPFTGSEEALELGDSSDNQPQYFELTFNTATYLPANAIIQDALLLVVLTNPGQYGRLQQELGNIYVTEGTAPINEQLNTLATGTPDQLAAFQSMTQANNSPNILTTNLKGITRDTNGQVKMRLFFELGSDHDNQPDLLHIWSSFDRQASSEHPPMLHVSYTLP